MIDLLLTDEKYFQSLLENISNSSIEIFALIFHAHPHINDPKCPVTILLTELPKKSNNSVTVSIIIGTDRLQPKLQRHNEMLIEFFKNSRVNIWKFNQNRLLHAKFFVFDKQIAILGSHNLSKESLRKSAETSILTTQHGVLYSLIDYFHHIQQNSKRIW